MPERTATDPAWAPHLPAGMAPDAVDLGAGSSLTGRWLAQWGADPGRPALVAGDGEEVSGAELEARSRAAAARLAAHGLVRGDRVLVSAATSVDLVVAYVGALRLGLVVVPVNTAYRAREVAHVVADAAPRAALVDDAERAGWVAEAAGDRPIPVLGVEVAGPTAPTPELGACVGDDPALMLYTSGTTGLPKGAPLSHGNLLASALAVGLAWRWTPEDRLVLALPLFHLHGLGVGLHGTFAAGATAILRPGFEAGDVLDAAAAHRASLFFGVPTMYARLARSGRLSELARLRLCVSGSAPLPAELHEQVAVEGGQRIVERYGMTETVMNVSNPHDGERRPGTVGLPLPGVELRLAAGSGEIELRGPNVFAGYWQRPEATAASFDDRWFRTGDVGQLDDDGYLRIVGRSKELIISGGYNVYPREVEDVLRAHPGVADVAVVGAPDPEWGEVVVAHVEAAEAGVDEAALLAFGRERLAPYKRPKRVVFTDALPRNALGKVVKGDLPG
ncbi:AMP-binding protein [Aquihabitans sp. G128]|uniref:AMP-binding protein n=1 Tax=Aquihabitans sp. G128 TaxID=2849779 RepID=UPI001C225B9F|nr:AMP-binding protein [Aquihabitans sp. G128]QXC61661.1 AMP-binding protein [Aquihabitans sp. G128]